MERVRSARDLDPNHDRDDLVYFTALPWIAFSSFQHARALGGREDSIPRVVFGKRHERGGRQVMPVSVEVHHALVDGLHLGQFYEAFQNASTLWTSCGPDGLSPERIPRADSPGRFQLSEGPISK